MSVKCPKCGSSRAKIKGSRPYNATKNGESFTGIRKKYMCMTCGEKYFSREVYVPDGAYTSPKLRRDFLAREGASRIGYASSNRDDAEKNDKKGA